MPCFFTDLEPPEYPIINVKDFVDDKLLRKVETYIDKQVLDETIEKFLIKTRTQYRKGRVYTFKDWIKIVRELLDELD